MLGTKLSPQKYNMTTSMTHQIRPLLSKPLHVAIYLVLLAFGQSVWAVEINNQTLRYAVDYRGTDAGELEIQISRDGDQYAIKTVSHLSMVAQLFLQSYTIETTFSVENGVPTLVSGKEELNQSGDTVREFTVNQKAREVEYKGADNVPFDDTTRVDAYAFHLRMML